MTIFRGWGDLLIFSQRWKNRSVLNLGRYIGYISPFRMRGTQRGLWSKIIATFGSFQPCKNRGGMCEISESVFVLGLFYNPTSDIPLLAEDTPRSWRLEV